MVENECDSCILQPMLRMGNVLKFQKSQLLYFTSRRAPFWRDVRDVRETCAIILKMFEGWMHVPKFSFGIWSFHKNSDWYANSSAAVRSIFFVLGRNTKSKKHNCPKITVLWKRFQNSRKRDAIDPSFFRGEGKTPELSYELKKNNENGFKKFLLEPFLKTVSRRAREEKIRETCARKTSFWCPWRKTVNM